MSRAKTEKRGPKHKPGYTKNQILLILSNIPEAVKEPELRDIIREQLGILDPKGIKEHLEVLKREGLLIKKDEPGKQNFWSINQSSFPILAGRFWGKPEEIAFHTSSYCQGLINQELVEKIKTDWGCTRDSEVIEKFKKARFINKSGKLHLLLHNTKVNNTLLVDLNEDKRIKLAKETIETGKEYLSDKDLEWILRLSPTALRIALDSPSKKPKNKNIFKELMFANLISDNRTFRLFSSDGVIKLNVELKVQLNVDNYCIPSINERRSYRMDKNLSEETEMWVGTPSYFD